MAFPTLKVEIAFASDPLDTTPTWTDVTAYVRQVNGVEINRGRNDPLSPFPAGRCTLTLSNRDRRFDSTYSSGPYYGNLKPRKQIRITATWSAVDYEMFTGFVGRWPQQFTNSGKDAVVELDCYDALDWAAGARLTDDLVEQYLDTIGAREISLRQADATSWTGSTTLSFMTSIGTFTPTASLVPGLSTPAVTFNGAARVETASAGQVVHNFWIRVDELQATEDEMNISIGSRGRVFVTTTGTLKCSWSFFATGLHNGSVESVRSINDKLPHMITLIDDGSVYLFIDGEYEATGSNTVGAQQALSVDTIGGWRTGLPGEYVYTNAKGITLQDFFTLDTTMTTDQVATLYQLSTANAVEDTATRVGRYLDDAGWPALWRDITTAPRGEVSTITYNSRQLINALQEVERSEQGRIFASKAGYITFHSRYFNFEVTRGTTSQATFSDDGAGLGYATFGFTEDDEYVRNDVTVTNTLNQSRSTNSASITTYGRRSETVNTILSTVQQVADMSDGLTVRWADQSLRIDAFTTTPPSDWASILGLELGDRITVEITPMATGSQLVKQLIIDSLRWSISDQGWWLTIGAAPVPTGVFVLGTSSLDGSDVLGF